MCGGKGLARRLTASPWLQIKGQQLGCLPAASTQNSFQSGASRWSHSESTDTVMCAELSGWKPSAALLSTNVHDTGSRDLPSFLLARSRNWTFQNKRCILQNAATNAPVGVQRVRQTSTTAGLTSLALWFSFTCRIRV